MTTPTPRADPARFEERPRTGTDTPRVETFEGDARAWDDFAVRQAGFSYGHRFGWNEVIGRVFGHETFPLAALDSTDRIQGILPLVRVKSRVFGHFLVSMPFINYGGPLGTPAAVQALADHAASMADGQGVSLLELRSRIELGVSLPVSHRKITSVLELSPGDPEAVWNGLAAKVRSQVRRPRKAGVTVRFGRDQLDGFFEVYLRHMRDLGTPAQPRAFFAALGDVFGDDVWFGCAYHEGDAVAGGCGFRWGDEFEMTWASALRSHSRIAPNMLLYWAFMERAAQQRLCLFNFGRCTPGSGTHRFKQQWGSRDETLWWYQHRRGGVTATPSPQQGAYAYGARLWRHLPLPIASVLGSRIVRYIP